MTSRADDYSRILELWNVTVRPTAATGAAMLVIAILIGAAMVLFPAQQEARSATLVTNLPPAQAATLIRATSGDAANELQASGEQARVINAALPFSSSAIEAARPFAMGGEEQDARRAMLCLTQAVYYEAGFEPLEGRRAVAQVILNRLRHPAFPKSICGVVYQASASGICQFTFVCDGALYRQPSRRAWIEAEAVARSALSGYVDRSVGEATHYHADYVAPRWAPMLTKIAQIGQHIFYRWPGTWGRAAAFNGRYIGEPQDPTSMRPRVRLQLASLESEEGGLSAPLTGPALPRAPNDVGGLLDTSKGWKLHIPGPDESGSATAQALALQGGPSASTSQDATVAVTTHASAR